MRRNQILEVAGSCARVPWLGVWLESVTLALCPTVHTMSYPKDMYVRRYAELVSELAYEY
jgi:hypothetical protein